MFNCMFVIIKQISVLGTLNVPMVIKIQRKYYETSIALVYFTKHTVHHTDAIDSEVLTFLTKDLSHTKRKLLTVIVNLYSLS